MNARELLAAATPRPWGVDPAEPSWIGGNPIGSENEWQQTVVDRHAVDAEDAALIVAAVNEYEALLNIEAHLRSMFKGWHPDTAALRLLARLNEIRGAT